MNDCMAEGQTLRRGRNRCDDCKGGQHCGGPLCECCNVPVAL